ncbi:MAG: hypothetical protein ACXVY8_03450 [Gaiellaceae bacterium]
MKAVFLGVGETLVAEELVAHVGDRVDNDQWGLSPGRLGCGCEG